MKHRPKHIFEYIVLRFWLGLATLLPLRIALAIGWLMGRFFFSVMRWRRNLAIARIEQVFGNRYTPAQRKRIAWISFRNLCFNAIEAARFHKLTLEQVRQMPLYPDMKRVHELHNQHGPLVFATAHMGNWDLAGVAGKLDGLPVFSIARRQKNPLTDAYLNKVRNATGMEVVLNDSRVLQNVVKKLKKGEVLAILPDVRQKQSDVQVDFLNGKASLGAGTALFAQMAKCPVVPVLVRRRGWTQHESVLFNPILPDPSADKKEDRARIMQELISALDTEIQAHPEQYFWFNKRWVLNPAPKA